MNEWMLQWILNEFWRFYAILDARLFSFKASTCSKIVLEFMDGPLLDDAISPLLYTSEREK